MSAALTASEPSVRYLATREAPLLAQFDLIAQSPGGIARLRELILSLAVQGKLVPQDPNDEPASALLERIRAEKARLVREGKISKGKPAAEIPDEEKPIGLPLGWSCARLADILTIWNGRAYSKPELLDAGTPVLRVGNLFTSNHWYYSDLQLAPEKYCERGDLLYAWSASFGPFVWSGPKAIYHYHIWKLEPFRKEDFNRDYLCLFLSEKTQEIRASGHGVSMLHMTKEKMEKIIVPLPPLAEQSRIVARAEELMALCDALEAKGKLQDEQHARLVGTLFDSLAKSESAHALAENWQRVAAHFDLLLDRPAAVDALEQTILQLAVRGLLVPQDPADEPASVLMQRIRAKKSCLIAAGKAKPEKPFNQIPENEDGSAPEGWTTVLFPELCSIGGGATPSKNKADYWDGDIPWVSPKDMKVEFIADAQDHVSLIALEETSLSLIPVDSLLIVVRGMILAHSFPVSINQVRVTINQDMKSLIPVFPELTPYLALVCKGFKEKILGLVEHSSHGTCKLDSEKLLSFRFGLPPLEEQSRIVIRVDELRSLCAQLRQRLKDAHKTQAFLADTSLETAMHMSSCMLFNGTNRTN
ncbi:restriction endonuclease subunit S [Rhodocyclus tenuis]|uniref:restriction endonuclease subunit S n=1 Tax=Rhodocyclus tenuis TaxID=1066 RepID=UPI0019085E3F|nr:restriction endonuclease subunit S [Rhodocyclus tenuis]MBK1681540.1 hypothetical protein [Rhodocyclus tenuis]